MNELTEFPKHYGVCKQWQAVGLHGASYGSSSIEQQRGKPGVESSYPEPSQKVRQVTESGKKRKIGRYCAINSNAEKEQHAV